jgi:hypothetical protein
MKLRKMNTKIASLTRNSAKSRVSDFVLAGAGAGAVIWASGVSDILAHCVGRGGSSSGGRFQLRISHDVLDPQTASLRQAQGSGGTSFCFRSGHLLSPSVKPSYMLDNQSMEVTMSDSLYDQWQKELKILLEKIEQHPSADLDAERDRVAILNTLIAKRSKSEDE